MKRFIALFTLIVISNLTFAQDIKSQTIEKVAKEIKTYEDIEGLNSLPSIEYCEEQNEKLSQLRCLNVFMQRRMQRFMLTDSLSEVGPDRFKSRIHFIVNEKGDLSLHSIEASHPVMEKASEEAFIKSIEDFKVLKPALDNNNEPIAVKLILPITVSFE